MWVEDIMRKNTSLLYKTTAEWKSNYAFEGAYFQMWLHIGSLEVERLSLIPQRIGGIWSEISSRILSSEEHLETALMSPLSSEWLICRAP